MSAKASEFEALPLWANRILPIVSLVLALLVFSYVWFRYNQAPLQLENWIRLGMIAIIGMVFLFSCLVYFLNKEMSWKSFISGIALIPILLLLQLVLFIIRLLKSFVQFVFADSIPEPVQKFIENYPSKFDIIILAVLFVLGVSWVVKKLKK